MRTLAILILLASAPLAYAEYGSKGYQPTMEEQKKQAEAAQEQKLSDERKKIKEEVLEKDMQDLKHRAVPFGKSTPTPPPPDAGLVKELKAMEPEFRACRDSVAPQSALTEIHVGFTVTREGDVMGERILVEGARQTVPDLYGCVLKKLGAHKFSTGKSLRKISDYAINLK